MNVDNMSKETLKNYYKEKFGDNVDDLTIEEEMKEYPERFQEFDKNLNWIDAETCNNGNIEVKQSSWNRSSLNNKLFYITKDKTYHEIWRRKE